MSLQNFVDKITAVSAAWLNQVDVLKFTIFGDAATKAQARTNLTSDAPLEINNGGTGSRTGPGQPTLSGVDSGVANSYVVAFTPNPVLAAGMTARFTPLNTNTGASTVNGAAVIRVNGQALTGGELSSLGPVILLYTGAQWQILLTAGAQPGFERTTAETVAALIAANYVYPSVELDIRRYGGKADNATDNSTVISNCMSLLTQLGGGTLILPDPGTYKTSGSILMPGKVRMQGAGMQATVLNYTGSGTFITFTSTGGTNDVTDITITGTAKTGIGVQFGDTAGQAGLCRLSRFYINGFATGIRIGGALWAIIEDGRIQQNTVGIDLNATSSVGGTKHSNVVDISRNQISFNDHEGIVASNVPERNQNIRLSGGSCEQNGVTDLTRYQLVTGQVEQLTIENVYFEYAAAGTKPNGINLNGAANFAIRECYFNTLSTAISATSTNNGIIQNCRFVGTITNDLNLSGGVNVHDVIADFTNTFSGIGNVLAGTNVWADIGDCQNATWTPTIKGASVAGTPVYGFQGASYSKQRNRVTFDVRVSITAKTGISGALSIEGLPVPRAIFAGVSSIFAAEYSGVTVSGANTYLYAELASNTTSLLLMQGGSTSNSQLTDANIAATTTVQITGSYQTSS